MRRTLTLCALWLALLVGGLAIGRQHRSSFGPKSDTPRDRGDVMLDVFGEFRTVLARYLWFKMDLFHEVLDDEGVPAEQQTEVLPLLRMVSLLDPSITDAYDNIAWDLYRGHRQAKQALAILDEGLARNKNNFQLTFRKATILFQEQRYAEALEEADKARSLAVDEMDVLNANRVVYWSAQRADDTKAAAEALDRLILLRPQDPLWTAEKSKLKRP